MGVRILLVEGDDDQHVIWNLRDVRDIPRDIYVLRPSDTPRPNKPGISDRSARPVGGDSPLLDSVPARLDTTGLERLAVVIDADGMQPQARWEALRSRLTTAGYEAELTPSDLDPAGLVIDLPSRQGRKPIRLGLWVMPDNESEGMLEDFVVRMIDEQDAMLPRVDGFLDSIPERRFSSAHRAKAQLHTWLAVSERPGRPMGQAIKADSHLDANHASVAPFLSWVTRALVD